MMVVEPWLFRAGMPTTEFGETRIVSWPRTRRTRPFRPVRMLSPGLRTASSVRDACCTPDVLIQTSPDDLLTRQTASAANASEPAPATTKTTRRNDAQIALTTLHMASLAIGGCENTFE